MKNRIIAIYPGTFDPVTYGHIDIIERASTLFNKVIVAIANNPAKIPLFTLKERTNMLRLSVEKFDNVEVDSFQGLLVKYAIKKSASVIIRGLRAVSDFEYEFQMSLMNKKLDSDKETVFMMTSAMNSYLSSSSVKQVAMFGGCIKGLVPEEIRFDIINKINRVYKKC